MKHQQGEALSPPGGGASAVPRKRKSRWGTSTDNGDEEASRRRSRWGDSSVPPPPPAPQAPQIVLPGMTMASSLPPQKQEEMLHLQARLRAINQKMEHMDLEAARVDALPRGHRERSPSPPPSKYIPIIYHCFSNVFFGFSIS
jgi:hypothetical protein